MPTADDLVVPAFEPVVAKDVGLDEEILGHIVLPTLSNEKESNMRAPGNRLSLLAFGVGVAFVATLLAVSFRPTADGFGQTLKIPYQTLKRFGAEGSKQKAAAASSQLDNGETWKEGVRLIEPIPPKYPLAYGVSAANLNNGRMLVTFFGHDPGKKETGDSPWSTTNTYLGSNVVLEKAMSSLN